MSFGVVFGVSVGVSLVFVVFFIVGLSCVCYMFWASSAEGLAVRSGVVCRQVGGMRCDALCVCARVCACRVHACVSCVRACVCVCVVCACVGGRAGMTGVRQGRGMVAHAPHVKFGFIGRCKIWFYW